MAGKKGATGSKSKPKTSNGGRKKTTKNSNAKTPDKKSPNISSHNLQTAEQDPEQSRKHRQHVLDIFRHAFAETLTSPDFTSTLQSVKQALFDRDFAKAFSDPHHLEVYAARWSPTRALCYSAVLEGIAEHLCDLYSPSTLETTTSPSSSLDTTTTTPPPTPPNLPVLSIGGGPAELVALASFLSQHPHSPSSPPSPSGPSPSPQLHSTLTLLDSGPYTPLINTLTTALTTPRPISPYASAAAKLANVPLLSSASLGDNTTTTTMTTPATTTPTVKTPPHLITLLFTLNELFTAGGLAPTTRFLLALTDAASVGSLLLVVDSPGSYSEVVIGDTQGKDGKKKREYPMGWLLDRVLLDTEREGDGGDDKKRWVKVEERESVWFRLGTGLEYPIGLEDMRYQMHLYRLDAFTGSA
ncbi:uncharacterized protein C8A04DRAFT_13509 [Dichotomopilus funicola]|uniref:25S rRNA (Uridine(2843)-N(3))-methyltransferase n=1 Tax=Dichotomopilus funicola TaxID=1934379 RepID=A0AAN6UZS9_9PEZI|nr:hypothetical protein C8A04DRAFT_13509 [Dichotomopilus funicola]